MKIGLFIPCFVDQFFPETGVSVVKIFNKLGVHFDYPVEQTCCGQPAYNTGYRKEAKVLAQRFLDIFSKYDVVVAPSGSCVGMVRNAYPTLDLDQEYIDRCNDMSTKIYEFSEFLVDKLNIDKFDSGFKGKVTYHDSCHLLRELKIQKQPRILLKNIKGIEFIESENSTVCCGFGGTFSIKFPEMSSSMVEDKVKGIVKSGADYVTALDSSCLMNIGGYLKRKDIKITPIHLADILAFDL